MTAKYYWFSTQACPNDAEQHGNAVSDFKLAQKWTDAKTETLHAKQKCKDNDKIFSFCLFSLICHKQYVLSEQNNIGMIVQNLYK